MQKHCGLDQATGRIIILTDDDCRLAPDDLTALVQAYDGDVVPALRGGRVELGDTGDCPLLSKPIWSRSSLPEEIRGASCTGAI
jgi:hypothetical protein